MNPNPIRNATARWVVALLLITAPAVLAESAATVPAKPVFDNGHHTVPIAIRLASGKVHVPVQVNGADPEWFILDTGVSVTILNRALADRLGLVVRGEKTVKGAAGGDGTVRVGFSKVASLRLPGLTLRGQGVAVLQRGTAGANGHPSSGSIGADLIKTLVVEIDYRAATIVLHDPAHFTYNGSGHTLPITLNANDRPLLDGSITLPNGDSLRARFGVDTGDRGLLTLHRHFVALHDLEDRLSTTPSVLVGYGVSGPVRHHTAHLEAIQLGDWPITRPKVTFPPLGASDAYTGRGRDGLLGARLFQGARVFLDYPNRRIIVEPPSDVPPTEEPPTEEPPAKEPPAKERLTEDASGLFVVTEGEQLDHFRVADVAPGSPADIAGLRVDDRITLLDGVPTMHLTLNELRRQLSRAGESIVLEVEREGKASLHTLQLRTAL